MNDISKADPETHMDHLNLDSKIVWAIISNATERSSRIISQTAVVSGAIFKIMSNSKKNILCTFTSLEARLQGGWKSKVML